MDFGWTLTKILWAPYKHFLLAYNTPHKHFLLALRHYSKGTQEDVLVESKSSRRGSRQSIYRWSKPSIPWARTTFPRQYTLMGAVDSTDYPL